jgi:putative membrane protein
MLISLRMLRRPSPGKALFAGALGGLAGGIVKAAAEVLYPPRVLGQASPPVLLVERIAGRSLSSREERLVENVVHFSFSAGVGALYGVVAEYWPPATAAEGGAFGVVLLGATHETALPALDLTEQPQHQSDHEQLSELLTHLVFGFTTEQVRRRLRASL